jgi:hypothetical protein
MVSAKMANYPSRQRLIHRSAWKRNSRKFTVASDPSDATVGARQRDGGALSALKRDN